MKSLMQLQGYRRLGFERETGYHILRNKNTGKREKWIKADKDFKGLTLLFGNTKLRFVTVIIPKYSKLPVNI